MSIVNTLSSSDIMMLSLSILLLLVAPIVVNWLNRGRGKSEPVRSRITLMRSLNALIIITILVKAFIRVKFPDISQTIAVNAIQVLVIIYFTALIIQIAHFLILRRFGKQREMQSQTLYADTYSSRALSLLAGIFIAVIALVLCLKAVGLNSWLEASGVIGIIGLFLAMTQATWAPDLLSGLIILNSSLCEEGDVVQLNLDNQDVVASVFKTKFFHTEFLQLANNHRLMIRNAKLRDCHIHNLSRFASARGLRECLTYNIGYEHSQENVEAMFKRAIDKLDDKEAVREEQFAPEIRVLDAGDYAVKWGLFYHTKNIKSILATRQLINAYVLDESIKSNISLSTPQLHIVEK